MVKTQDFHREDKAHRSIWAKSRSKAWTGNRRHFGGSCCMRRRKEDRTEAASGAFGVWRGVCRGHGKEGELRRKATGKYGRGKGPVLGPQLLRAEV